MMPSRSHTPTTPASQTPGARRPRRITRGEEGFVMVFVLALLAIGVALGAAALAETLSSRSSTNLDARKRRALQAADFGVQAVLYNQNQLNVDSLDLTGGKSVLGKLADCIVPVVNEGLKIEGTVRVTITDEGVSGNASKAACPVAQGPGAKGGTNGTQTEIAVGNHDSYIAEFYPGETVASGSSGVTFKPKIVAIGIDDNGNKSDPNQRVYARVEANLAPIEPFKTVEALKDLTFNVLGNTAFNGTARAGHNVIFNGTGSFIGTNILGSEGNVVGPTAIDYGCKREGEQILGVYKVIPVLAGGLNEVKEGTKPCEEPYFKRQAISISGSKPSCSISCPVTGYVSGREANGTASSTLTNEDEIYISNGATLTLTPGNDYVFCSFVTNGPVEVPLATTNASPPVRIFIDSPSSSRCKEFVKHNGISAGSFKATKGIGGAVSGALLSPTQMQIYLVGNGENDGTTFESTSTALTAPLGNAFFLYAPQSEVKVTAPVFAGTLVGYDVKTSVLVFTQDVGLDNYPLSNSQGVFHVTGYTQCPSANSSGKTVTELTTTSIATDTSGC